MTATAKVIHLYDIPPALDRVYQEIADGEGEVTPELQADLDALHEKLGDKLQAIRDWYFSLKASAAAVDSEIQRLRDHRAGIERTMTWAKEYVRANLHALQIEKYPLRRGKLWLQNNSSWSISWPGAPETAPKAYQRWTCSVNGEKAQEDFKAGTLPEGFTAERGKHMRLS